MTDKEIVELVKAALIKTRPDLSVEFESVGIGTRFESLRIDSVDTLRMITFVEDSLGFVFEDEDLSRIETIKDLAGLVNKHR
jgi:acyl carrier protein